MCKCQTVQWLVRWPLNNLNPTSSYTFRLSKKEIKKSTSHGGDRQRCVSRSRLISVEPDRKRRGQYRGKFMYWKVRHGLAMSRATFLGSGNARVPHDPIPRTRGIGLAFQYRSTRRDYTSVSHKIVMG